MQKAKNWKKVEAAGIWKVPFSSKKLQSSVSLLRFFRSSKILDLSDLLGSALGEKMSRQKVNRRIGFGFLEP